VNSFCIDSRAISKGGELPEIAKPEVGAEALTHIDASTLEDSFVYVHCYFRNKWENMLIRIWKTTFLVDELSGTRSQLLHAENISIAPAWTQIPDGLEYSFLLIFSGLPKGCKQFDLVEEITEPGGFLVKNITRNDTDVYHINISS
jgi:hypothetical protein